MPPLSHIIHKQLPPPLGDVEYIYNDDQFIIVDKPANMLSVPGKTPEKQDCLIHRVQQRFPEALIDHQHGKAAQTFWRILERHEKSCSLELTPVTGRTHQLRVHMQALGHPILGDELYGHKAAFAMADRLYLHARKLIITHPTDNNRLTFLSTIEPF